MQVISYFTMLVKREEEQSVYRLDKHITSIQEICFFLKTFCSETELHTEILKSQITHDKTAPEMVVEDWLNDIDLEYKPPENPNEIFPYELYPDIFTYKTIDLSKCE